MSVNGEKGDFENSELKRDQKDSNEKINSEEQKLRIELEKLSEELNIRKRELEVEAALEKVRGTAMAMQQSGDLRALVQILYEQLRNLGFQWGAASIIIMDPETGDLDWWMEGFGDGYDLPECYHVPFFDHPGHLEQLKNWKDGEPYAEIEISGQEKKTYDAYYFFKTDFSKAPDSSKQLMMQQETVRFSMAFMKYGALSWSPSPLSIEQGKILERFAKVFEQCYTRFLDLQKAEAQAREAQIEVALERVRSRALAMHTSDGILEVTQVLREQIALLGEKELESILVHIYYEESDEFEAWYSYRHPDDTEDQIINGKQRLSWIQTARARKDQEKYHEGQSDYCIVADYTMLKEWYEYLLTVIPEVVKKSEDGRPVVPDVLYYNYSKISGGALLLITNSEASEHSKYLLRRTANVFNLAYSRFLDLQKAEAQAREAQIEAALERVRSKAMAMHESRELSDVVHELRKQMGMLGQQDLETCVIHLNEESPDFVHSWAAVKPPSSGKDIQEFTAMIPKRGYQIIEEALEAYSGQTQDYVLVNEGEKLYQWFDFLKEESPDSYVLVLESAQSLPQTELRVFWSFSDFSGGSLLMVTLMPPDESSHSLLRRFANVFGLAYRRFADLKQAEALARESKIEAALEKIRSRSLAMHHSQELREVIAVFFEKLNELGVLIGTVGIVLYDHKTKALFFWVGNSIQDPQLVFVPFDEAIMMEENFISHCWKAMVEKTEMLNVVYSREQKDRFFRHLFANNDLTQIPESAREILKNMETHTVCLFPNIHSALFVDSWDGKKYSDEDISILRRADKVFEQAYIRFLDLQKAEAQAREAQVEVALERVRARTMAMHSSSELIETAELLFDQLKQLGAETQGVAFAICDPNSTLVQKWTSIGVFSVPYTFEAGEQRMYEAWKKQTEIYEEVYEGKRLRNYYELFMKIPEFKQGIKKFIDNGNPLPDWQKNHAIPFKYGYLLLITLKPFEETHIFTRFAKVFEQTYTRFLDLQKAEAQAREAQIEASLERIRSKAMSMHSSQDLTETIGTFYRELQTYSLTPLRCGVGILSKNDKVGELFTWNTTEEGQSLELVGKIKMEGHPVLENVYESWLTQTEYHPVLRGEEIKEYYQILRPQMAFPNYQHDEVHNGYFFFFPEGGVYAWTLKEMQEDELKIYRRFTSVLSLTYKRYKDLKDAEARALLAIRESSLARVRAEIASMRTAEDLQRITPLIWHELTALGVPFFRCGIFIVNEKEQKAQVYLSNPEGNSLAVLSLGFDSSETNRKAIEHWRSQKVYVEHWDREQFAAYAQSLIEQGQIQTARSYQGGEEPPESLTLHFLPFSQGMLYVGSAGPLTDFHLELAKALAEAFSVAYARYEDFSKLESAKKQVEKALVDLKQTQEQLVQQEKMASLGHLTAGIAHEIKNPLNFVNNFSEVSIELIEEVFGELEKLEASACKEEIMALLEDVKSNIAKVNEHGRRADGIVKSMLQHSRSSGNKTASKEFNPIVREFANLAYHGMRAGKSPINVEIDLKLDPEVGEVKLISEDFSRVILNLCNNAFDAMREKLQEVSPSQSDYLPRLTICTKKTSDREIQLTIKDNGKGIPKDIIDKILEPFFTTKKGTEGTGLGLSISYDIIKAHGGKLEVRSQLGIGTEFIIQIPITF